MRDARIVASDWIGLAPGDLVMDQVQVGFGWEVRGQFRMTRQVCTYRAHGFFLSLLLMLLRLI